MNLSAATRFERRQRRRRIAIAVQHGLPCRDAAAHFHVSSSTVRRACDEFGARDEMRAAASQHSAARRRTNIAHTGIETMLTRTCREGEVILIGERIRIAIKRAKHGRTTLEIEAPREMNIAQSRPIDVRRLPGHPRESNSDFD